MRRDCRFWVRFRKLTLKPGKENTWEDETSLTFESTAETWLQARTQHCHEYGYAGGRPHTRTQNEPQMDGWMAARLHLGRDACTCLKLKDLVSACESSSSGSPSGPPASSSPAPPPRTADHVHFAHCTGDRICQGLNAMSAAPPAPAPKSRGRGRAFFPFQNGGNR